MDRGLFQGLHLQVRPCQLCLARLRRCVSTMIFYCALFGLAVYVTYHRAPFKIAQYRLTSLDFGSSLDFGC